MLVGLQKQGKTTLLTRLRDINEVETTLSTFNERIKGENSTVSTSFKAPSFLRRYGPRESVLIYHSIYMYCTHVYIHVRIYMYMYCTHVYIHVL